MQEQKEIVYVDINLVDDSPYNPRQDYRSTEMLKQIASLGSQIKHEAETNHAGMDYGWGVLQAPMARLMASGRYQQAFGHTRKRAVLHIGGKLFPLVVADLSDSDMERMGIVENNQQKAMSNADYAASYARKAKAYGYANIEVLFGTPEELAAKRAQDIANELAIGKVAKEVGMEAAKIRDYLYLLSLPAELRQLFDTPLSQGGVSMSLVSDIQALPDDLRHKILRGISSRKMKVADAKALIDTTVAKKRQSDYLASRGMQAQAQRLFEAAPVASSVRFAKALYSDDMASITDLLAKWGDTPGDKDQPETWNRLQRVAGAVDINTELDRLKCMVATIQRMQRTLVDVQSAQTMIEVLAGEA